MERWETFRIKILKISRCSFAFEMPPSLQSANATPALIFSSGGGKRGGDMDLEQGAQMGTVTGTRGNLCMYCTTHAGTGCGAGV